MLKKLIYHVSLKLPIPVFAPVTRATFFLKSLPWSTDIAVLDPSNLCLSDCCSSLYSVAKANRGSA